MKPGKSMFLFMSAGTGAGVGVGIARIIIPDHTIIPDHITAADPGPVDTVAAITVHGDNNNIIKPDLTVKESPLPVIPYLFSEQLILCNIFLQGAGFVL